MPSVPTLVTESDSGRFRKPKGIHGRFCRNFLDRTSFRRHPQNLRQAQGYPRRLPRVPSWTALGRPGCHQCRWWAGSKSSVPEPGSATVASLRCARACEKAALSPPRSMGRASGVLESGPTEALRALEVPGALSTRTAKCNFVLDPRCPNPASSTRNANGRRPPLSASSTRNAAEPSASSTRKARYNFVLDPRCLGPASWKLGSGCCVVLENRRCHWCRPEWRCD